MVIIASIVATTIAVIASSFKELIIVITIGELAIITIEGLVQD